jgi:hypothetical protein
MTAQLGCQKLLLPLLPKLTRLTKQLQLIPVQLIGSAKLLKGARIPVLPMDRETGFGEAITCTQFQRFQNC